MPPCPNLIPVTLAADALSWLERVERAVVHTVTCTWRGEPLATICKAVESKLLPVLLLVALTAWVARSDRRLALRVLFTAAVGWGAAMLVADGLWAVLERPRPTEVLAPLLRTPEEQATCASRPEALALHSGGSRSPGFPSRHALTVGVFAAALWWARRSLGALAAVYGLAVCLQRLYSGKHWPTDLLAGLVLGVGLAWLAWRAYLPLARRLGVEPPAAAGPPDGGDPGGAPDPAPPAPDHHGGRAQG